MRPVLSMDDLQQIRSQRRGFIYNDFTKTGAAGGRDNVLHAAGCGELRRMTSLTVPKLFFDTRPEAEEWLLANRGPEDERWRRCGRCRASGPAADGSAIVADVTSTLAPATTPAVPGEPTGFEPFREEQVTELLYRHLREAGYRVETDVRVPSGRIDAVATSDVERIVIEVKGEDRGAYTSAQLNFQVGVGQLASRMTDHAAVYALAFPDTNDYRRVMRTFNDSLAFARLRFRFYLVDRDGTVLAIEADDIAEWIASL